MLVLALSLILTCCTGMSSSMSPWWEMPLVAPAGAQEQLLLLEWPCSGPVSTFMAGKAAQSGTNYFVERIKWCTELFLPEAAQPWLRGKLPLHTAPVLSKPLVTLSKSAPAPACWYQYNINLSWASITSSRAGRNFRIPQDISTLKSQLSPQICFSSNPTGVLFFLLFLIELLGILVNAP